MKFPKIPWKNLFSLVVLFGLMFSASRPTTQVDAQARTITAPQPITIRPVKVGVSLPHTPVKAPADAALVQSVDPAAVEGSMPTPIFTLDGLANVDNMQPVGTQQLVIVPDTNGDIGPSHYIQAVNNLYRVYSPSTGQILEWYRAISSLFEGFGGLCENNDEGSPIVLYDHLADRWVISQMARNTVAPNFEYHQCIAISSSPDPVSGSWFLYDFQVITSSANLYTSPKLAVWTNGYYMTLDQWKYNNGTWSSAGQGVAVLEREKMLLGQNARMIYFDLFNSNPELHNMVPADLDGFPPPADTPGYFLQIDDDGRGAEADQISLWQLDVNWNNEFAAWGPLGKLAVSNFDSKFTCNSTTYTYNCIPQPGATSDQYLDVISDRLMYRVQYRYQGDDEHLILNHTVDSGVDQASIRWYHLKTDINDAWQVFEFGTHSPDSNHHWLGSAAMDASGNIAVGYSVSSTSVFPSIRYAGRLSTDAAGSLAQGEVTVVNGTGIQQDAASRWGNYSSMTVDPTDQCTFWYTNQYVKTTGLQPWETKISKFNFGAGSCATPPASTISGTVYDSLTHEIIPYATVVTSTGYMTQTGADGIYTLIGLPTDEVLVTASSIGFVPSSQLATPPATSVDFFLSRSEDDYDGALVIPGIPYQHIADTTIATSALDDPLVTACGLGAGSATLWYKYTAPANQPVYIDTYGTDYDTFIAVWTGLRGNLTPVICNNNAGGGTQSSLTLSAVEETTYYIEVGQANTNPDPGGNLMFHITTFQDIQGNHWAWRFIEGLYAAKVTGGCNTSPLQYCPTTSVTRDQMSIFLLRAKYGSEYTPPAVGASTGFTDVPVDYWAAAWIKQLAAEGITGGCGDGVYCPTTPVTRDQMAVFLLRAKYGSSFVPEAAIGVFDDVPINYWAASWIEKLAEDGITGGCGGEYYCPGTVVTRDQMAIFLDKTFDIPLLP